MEKGGGGEEGEGGTNGTHILPYVRKTANGNLLYESGSSNQSSVSTYSYGKGWEVGRRFKREGTHVSYG